MEKIKKRIEKIKEKRSGYGEILDFYQKVKEAQNEIKGFLKIEATQMKKEWKDLLKKEGFPLIQKEDFPMDLEASPLLFQKLCIIGKSANPYMAGQIVKIEEALNHKTLDLVKLFKEKFKEKKLEKLADDLGVDKKIFLFLIQMSIQPSIEATVEKFRSEVDPETWLKGYCPICGSHPFLSVLKEEGGKRYLLCSYCNYRWRTDRLFCPFCNNNEQGSLHYFYGEGEDAFRIDLCDKCHQYIKTIDYRKLEEIDPILEDLATLHLDLLASQKGYQRPIPNPWTT